ncbi:MAG: Uma2 family endonuclease [Acidobacteria bacterium]|nr:Uma2 family endonuclease [Acidobacteriota bacterium]
MAARAQERATYDDLLRAPENMIAELVDGELYMSPRPGGPHGRVTSVLTMDIGTPYDRGRGGPGGWLLIHEPEIHFELNRLVLVPDIAGWRRERMATVPSDHRFLIPPDWICEVSSPSTYRLDRQRELPIYAEYGVRHAWLVDPERQAVEILRLESEHWVLANTHGGDDRFRAEPFEEVEIDFASFWDSPPSP